MNGLSAVTRPLDPHPLKIIFRRVAMILFSGECPQLMLFYRGKTWGYVMGGERGGAGSRKMATRGWEDFVKRFPRDGTFILFTLRISGRNHANSVLSPDHAPSHETDFTALSFLLRALSVLPILLSRRLSGRWLICFFDDDGKGDQIWIGHKPIEESRCRDSRISFISDVILLDSRFDLWIGLFRIFLFFFFKEHWFIVKLDITVFQSSIKYVYF